jgi:hypothetical protein
MSSNSKFGLGVCVLLAIIWAGAWVTIPEERITINGEPLSSFSGYRVSEVVFELDTDGDGEFDSTVKWVNEK